MASKFSLFFFSRCFAFHFSVSTSCLRAVLLSSALGKFLYRNNIRAHYSVYDYAYCLYYVVKFVKWSVQNAYLFHWRFYINLCASPKRRVLVPHNFPCLFLFVQLISLVAINFWSWLFGFGLLGCYYHIVVYADDSFLSDRPATNSHTWVAPGKSGSRNTSPQNEKSISPTKTVGSWKSKELSSEDDFQRNPYVHGDAFKRWRSKEKLCLLSLHLFLRMIKLSVLLRL